MWSCQTLSQQSSKISWRGCCREMCPSGSDARAVGTTHTHNLCPHTSQVNFCYIVLIKAGITGWLANWGWAEVDIKWSDGGWVHQLCFSHQQHLKQQHYDYDYVGNCRVMQPILPPCVQMKSNTVCVCVCFTHAAPQRWRSTSFSMASTGSRSTYRRWVISIHQFPNLFKTQLKDESAFIYDCTDLASVRI